MFIPDPRWEEPSLLIPGKKPTGPVVIDWSHPLARGLVGCLIVQGGGWVDLIDGNRPSADTSTVRASSTGLGRDYSGTKQTRMPNRARYGLAGAQGGSILAIVDIDATSSYSAIASCQDTTTTNGWEFRLSNGTSDGVGMMLRAGAGYQQWRADTTRVFSAGDIDTRICITWPNNTLSSGNYPTFFVNGMVQPGGGIASGSGTAAASTHDLFIGRREAGTTQHDGAIFLILLWDRGLSDAEAVEISRNPYQILCPA